MIKPVLAAVAVLTLSACAHHRNRTTIDYFNAPSGTHGLAITCRRVQDCYRAAGDNCQHGYELIDKDVANQRGFGLVSNNMVFTRSRHSTVLMVSCQ